MSVPDISFQDLLTRPARNELAGQIRRLELRLAEVEKLDPNAFDTAELHALGIGIREALADAFGLGTFAYDSYSPAADFGVPFDASVIHVDRIISARRRSLALLRRAVQSKKEAFENKYPGAELPESIALHTSFAGRAMADATSAGSGASGIDPREPVSLGAPQLSELTLDATAEVKDTPESAFNLLLARVAALEAALDAPKPQMDLPIGPGHNGPPEFEPPFEEEEIRKLIDLLKAQAPTSATDRPKLLDSAKIAEANVSKLRIHIDEFTTAAVKAAGTEVGKRLAQLPWWIAVSAALNSVTHALMTWIGTLPH